MTCLHTPRLSLVRLRAVLRPRIVRYGRLRPEAEFALQALKGSKLEIVHFLGLYFRSFSISGDPYFQSMLLMSTFKFDLKRHMQH
jgi:hypothetical protein